MDLTALFVLGLFMMLQLAIAFWASRNIKTETDYLLGGRNLGILLASFSLFATWFGAETVMGSSGAIAANGLSGARAEPFGYALCLLLFALFIAYRMRAAEYVTTSDFYGRRFGAYAEKMSAFLVIPTSLMWSAAQIVAFAHIFAAVSGLDYNTALLAGSLLIVLYTTVDGYMGDVTTDFVMGIVVITGLFLTAVAITGHIGGLDAALGKITPDKLSLMSADETILSQMDQWMIAIVGSLVSQEAISRFLGTKTPRVARNACLIAAGMYLIVGLIPAYIGLVGSGIVNADIQNSDSFLPVLVKTVLPGLGYIIFLGALISAILSTINSTLLSVGALAGHNIILPLTQDSFTTQTDRIRIERLMVIFAGFITYAIAVSGQSIYDLIEASSSFGSAGLLVCLIFGLWTRIGGGQAALFTMAIGVLTSWLFQYQWEWEGGYIASVATCLIVFLAVSLFEQKKVSSAHA